MKLNTAIVAFFSAVCILAILSCQSKTEPAQVAAFQKSSPQDTLIKSSLPDTHRVEKYSRNDTGKNPSIDNQEKSKMAPHAHKNPTRHAVSPPLDSSSKPAGAFANDLDFICGMEVMPDYTDTCHLNGKVYAFCSEYCKDKFKENPEKYLSKH